MSLLAKVITSIVLFLFAYTNALADTWIIRPEESRLGLIVTQQGAEFEAIFENFTAEIEFDPEQLQKAHVHVDIDLASFKSENDARDKEAKGDNWFSTALHPTATFEAAQFRVLEDGFYEAKGILTILGVSKSVALQFSLEIEDDVANMQGSASVVRTDFNIGTSAQVESKAVGQDVIIEVSLVADR